MIENRQRIVNSKRGDCFRACITSILNIPNDPSLPTPDDPRWFIKWSKFLAQFGLEIVYEHKSFWRRGYWIASVPSLNFKGVSHAIVMSGDRVRFDPTKKKGYKKGRNLLGKEVIQGGWYFEVTDASKLHKLIELQK